MQNKAVSISQNSPKWLLWMAVLLLLLASMATCLPYGRGRRAPAIFSPDRQGFGTVRCSKRDNRDCFMCATLAEDMRIYNGCCERRKDYLAFCDRLLA